MFDTRHRTATGGTGPDSGSAPLRQGKLNKMDPQEFRSLGHQVIDELADYLDTIEDQRVFPDVDSRQLEAIFD